MDDTTSIISIATIIITFILGILSKKSAFISNQLIPIQNIGVGVVIAIVEWFITKDFEMAIAMSGLIAGGTYDLIHNLEKIIRKE